MKTDYEKYVDYVEDQLSQQYAVMVAAALATLTSIAAAVGSLVYGILARNTEAVASGCGLATFGLLTAAVWFLTFKKQSARREKTDKILSDAMIREDAQNRAAQNHSWLKKDLEGKMSAADALRRAVGMPAGEGHQPAPMPPIPAGAGSAVKKG